MENITHTTNNTCLGDLFGLEREKCNKWIFSEDEVTIVNDVSLSLREISEEFVVLGMFIFVI